ncbi:hypothetical protein BT96DRAFT_913110 [Gymnopus androsaceus JB14]|uniref:Uncharacterized protein n=1 Tax=Gymnopus androsaceus JB14 TaxID=1447944 RepID=A0A6A4IIR6_9AGAR|nr:hypothetical protein BT96DRAFT_913110 [Gymnopus androsaceus JB14]
MPGEREHSSKHRQPLDLAAVSAALQNVHSRPPLPDVSREFKFRTPLELDVNLPFTQVKHPSDAILKPISSCAPVPRRLAPLSMIPVGTDLYGTRAFVLPALSQPAVNTAYSVSEETSAQETIPVDMNTFPSVIVPSPYWDSMPAPVPSRFRTPPFPYHTKASVDVCSTVYPHTHPFYLRMLGLWRPSKFHPKPVRCPLPRCLYSVQQSIEGIREHLISHHPTLYAYIHPEDVLCSCRAMIKGGGEAVAHHIASSHFRTNEDVDIAKCLNCFWFGTIASFAHHLLECPGLAHLRADLPGHISRGEDAAQDEDDVNAHRTKRRRLTSSSTTSTSRQTTTRAVTHVNVSSGSSIRRPPL